MESSSQELYREGSLKITEEIKSENSTINENLLWLFGCLGFMALRDSISAYIGPSPSGAGGGGGG